jgi:Ca2+-transporting ATPase
MFLENTLWHSTGRKAVLAALNTSENGLSNEEAQKRLEQSGPNALAEEKKISAFRIFINQFKNVTIYVLLFACILSLIHFTPEGTELKITAEAVVISIIIAIGVIVGFIEEYKAGKDMDALKKLSPKIAKIFRDGKISEVDVSEIVPGDIISIERGCIIPADARILHCNNLHVDESILTGESVPVVKKEGKLGENVPLAEQYNMLFGSTQVTNGNALAVVVRTGKDTEIGKISTMLAQVKEEETPLQKRLNRLGKQMSLAVAVICVLIFIIGIVRGEPVVNLTLLAVAVAVSGIPESLPTIIAVILAVGTKKMAKRNAIIKSLPTVETLGTCSVICSDKTGTLTQNKMVIERLVTLDAQVDVTGSGFDPKGLFLIEGKEIDLTKHHSISKVIEIGILCNNSDIKQTDGEWGIDGEPTEGALIVLAKKAGIDHAQFRSRHTRIKEHPFDPDRKMMSTVHIIEKKQIVHTKGAPELLLKKTDYYLSGGIEKKMTPEINEWVLKKNEEYASKGMRVLALAYKEHTSTILELEQVESKLVFVGLAVMRDPPEEHAKESVRMCREAGITVVMITGDNKITAQAIAKDLGIYNEGDMVLEGHELDSMSEDEFFKIVDHVKVYARTTPKHKLKIVAALQKKGNIVAMTGDGVNDAPALKKADIGIAMGKRGTDVAKDAAKMILKDDNFSTIVSAVKEGRTIYANIQKFLYYTLTASISEVSIICIAILLGMNPPLTALMILFLNLVTGDFPSLGLSIEKAPADIMKQKPRNPKESILSQYLMLKISQVIPLIVLGCIALYMWEIVMKQGTIQKAQTIAFVTLIMFELFHVFNAKSWDESAFSTKSIKNVLLNAGVIYSLLFTFLVVYYPPLQRIFDTVALGASEVIMILVITFIILMYNEVQKTAINAELKEREKMAMTANT